MFSETGWIASEQQFSSLDTIPCSFVCMFSIMVMLKGEFIPTLMSFPLSNSLSLKRPLYLASSAYQLRLAFLSLLEESTLTAGYHQHWMICSIGPKRLNLVTSDQSTFFAMFALFIT
ncbi:hypothetical protein XENORESO_012904 [Xenotaenia resolanae]|uniref:Uncharacterized protein n=1 Tax=Xenotaenia resolanae TaxID=208358 RepID=A0ABV0WFQ4_9TELE